ncbi:RNA polymerase ECF family sigma subunit [Herbihabitans rhizosphaerae]|uniref:RNA polymerase sigma factor n=1 Tax=Herbihabitans rhizosphaerae TaxID=1872711 RepID=A0A4Q7KJ46_9PSEU|nr:RNA polymerase ECF family sigma subunit [Herbihabitans rhizosphaerae]
MLLDAARGGDEHAFRDLLEPHQRELHVHCYRMTGSVHDADDVLQEVLLRAWRSLTKFEGRSSFRAWLYRIATNACLTAVSSRSKRALPTDFAAPPEDAGPVTESVWLEPYPDQLLPDASYEQREGVELAFVAALQHLPANQRAALILREVLGFSAKEVADALGATTAAVNSALQHARKAVAERVPDRSQQATLRALDDEKLRAIVADYTRALERHDIDAIVSMLAEDATWSMPPLPQWYRGHEAITAFLLRGPLTEGWRHIPTSANGQLAVGCYMWDEERQAFVGQVIDVLTVRGTEIASITAFIDTELFPRFDLPKEFPGER